MLLKDKQELLENWTYNFKNIPPPKKKPLEFDSNKIFTCALKKQCHNVQFHSLVLNVRLRPRNSDHGIIEKEML